MLGFAVPQSPEEWFSILPTIAMVLVGIAVLFGMLLFAVALLEKRHGRGMRPLSASDPRSRAAAPATVAAGHASEFDDLGVWTDGDKGMSEGIHTLMLSPDGCTLLSVRHGKLAGRYRLITRLPDVRWLITSSMSGEPDLSGFEVEKMMPGKAFHEVLAAHNARVSASPLPPVPFTREHIAEEMLEHEQARIGRLIANGLAKRLSGPGDRWSYTLRGAFRVAIAGLGNIRSQQRQAAMQRPAASLGSPLEQRRW